MDSRHHRLEISGAAHLVLADGVAFLDAQEAVFRAMLQGWRMQQESRQLKEDTIYPRLRFVTRLHEFTNLYPWEWTPLSLEDFSSTEFRSRQRATGTVRAMHNAIGLFCDYITDDRYDWVAICKDKFQQIPIQICTEMNTLQHLDDYEGSPERRPFTPDEVQKFFDYIDDRYDSVKRLKRKGSLAILRDSTLFKTVACWGLRRREVAKLTMEDRHPNPEIPEYGRYGALHVRFGKAVKGGRPRRRTVYSMPYYEWAIDALKYYCEEVRPQFNPGNHPAMFISERRTYLGVRWIDERFLEYRRGAGLPEELDLHCLRHYYATDLAEEDTDALLVQDQLGHRFAATTSIYVHTSRDYKLRTLRDIYNNLYRQKNDKKDGL